MNDDWEGKLKNLLIGAGVNGMKQSELVKSLQNDIYSEDIERKLEFWFEQDKVQKFHVPPNSRQGRPAVVWRATSKLLKG